MDSTNPPFERNLIPLALIATGSYLAILFLLVQFVDRTTAAMVGPALTLLISIIVNRLELKDIDIPTFHIWYLLLLLFAFIGIQMLVGFILGIAMSMIIVKDLTDFFTIVSHLQNTPYLAEGILVAINCVSYLIGGFLCGKTAPYVRYGYAALTAIATVAVNFLLLAGLVRDIEVIKQLLNEFSGVSAVCLVYVIMTIIGVRMGSHIQLVQHEDGRVGL